MDNYQVLHLIGEGCFGKVFKGRRKFTGEAVALKFISTRGKSEKDLKNFRQEMAILKDLNHENIIRLLDAFETASDFVVVTEYGHGELFEIFQDDRQLPESEVQKIAKQLVHALYYLHSNRVIHRDMKPQNILIGSNNKIKLCDFGFARSMSNQTVVLNSVKGTPLYMAPELVQEKPYNHTVDIWSLGVILYELVVGSPPFYTNSLYSLINLIINDSVKYPSSLSPNFKSFLQGLLQKNPSNRLSWPQLLHHPFIADECVEEFVPIATPTLSLPSDEMFAMMERRDNLPSDSLFGLIELSLDTIEKKSDLKRMEIALEFLTPLIGHAEVENLLRSKSLVICKSLISILSSLSMAEPTYLLSITMLGVWFKWDPEVIESAGFLKIAFSILSNSKDSLLIEQACICLESVFEKTTDDCLKFPNILLSISTPASIDCLYHLREHLPVLDATNITKLVQLRSTASIKILINQIEKNAAVSILVQQAMNWSVWHSKLSEPFVIDLLVLLDCTPWATSLLVSDVVELILKDEAVIRTRLLIQLLRVLLNGKRDADRAVFVLELVGRDVGEFLKLQTPNEVFLILGAMMDDTDLVMRMVDTMGEEGKIEVLKILKKVDFSNLVKLMSQFDSDESILMEISYRLESTMNVSSDLILEIIKFGEKKICMLILSQIIQVPEACMTFVNNGGLELMNRATLDSNWLTILSNLARSSPEFYKNIHEELAPYKGLKQLLNDDPVLVAKTCNTIGNLSRHNDFFYPYLLPLVGDLIAVLSSSDVNSRKFASFALGNLAFHSAKLYSELSQAVLPLVKLLSDEDEKTRANAAGALGNLVRNSDLLVDTMIKGGAVEALLANATKRSAASGRIALFSLGNLAMHARSKALLRQLGAGALARSAAAHAKKVGDTQTVKYCDRLEQKMS